MKRSLQASFDAAAFKYPTYAEHPEPIRYEMPFDGAHLLGFRRRWSEKGYVFTQQNLAEWVEMHPKQIARYERDIVSITPCFLLALCELDRRLGECREEIVR